MQALPSGVQMCSDGWKSRSCEQGTSLINCLILKPNSRSIFFEVTTPDSTRKKDAEYIAEVSKDAKCNIAIVHSDKGRLNSFLSINV
jgi:hypothetical protein